MGQAEIRFTIAIEISHDKGKWRAADRDVRHRSEGSVSVPDEDGDIIRISVRYGEIESAISIEIACNYAIGICSDKKAAAGGESTFSVAAENQHLIGAEDRAT